MTIKELQDYILNQRNLYNQDFAGIDYKYKLQLDEDNWKEIQQCLRECSASLFVNGEYKQDANLKDYTFTSLRIPYVGEFEIIKSDKFNIEKVGE